MGPTTATAAAHRTRFFPPIVPATLLHNKAHFSPLAASLNPPSTLPEPKPGPGGRLAVYRRVTRQPLQRPAEGGGLALGQMLAMGAGVGLVFALLARLL